MPPRLTVVLLVTTWPANLAWAGEPQTSTAPAESMAAAGEQKEMTDIDLFTLEVPMVVTASRHEQKASSVPYALTVITAEDIRRSGARSVPDALRLAAGMDVAETSFGSAAVGPRGMYGFLARDTLVLVDGRQVFDSLFGGTLWGSWPFQLEDIERIEVIRGSGGVTWGANAVTGVINIISKDPRDQLGLTTTGGGGSRGTQKEHVGYAFQEGKLRLRVSGEYEGSDGFNKGGSFLQKPGDDYKSGRSSVYGVYDAGPKDKLTFSGGSGLLDGGYQHGPFIGLEGTQNPNSQASFALGRWEHQIAEDNRFQLNGFVNDFYGSLGWPAAQYRYQQLALQLNHTFKPADAHTVSWGVDTRTDLADGGFSDPYLMSRDFVSSETIGLYAQDDWRFAPRWSLNLGGRIDYESYGGFEPSARAALSYDLTDTSMLYGAVSRAYHMPPVGERFLNEPLAWGLASVVGDREFDSQTLIAYELGYRASFFDRLNTNLNLYWHETENIASLRPGLGPPGLVRVDIAGMGEASYYGVEWDGKYRVSKTLTLLGNYTLQFMDYRASLPYTFATDLIRPPRHKFMLGACYSPLEDLHLSSYLYYVDATLTPNPGNPLVPLHADTNFRLDLRAEYEFWKKQASVAVGVRNLLEPSHYEGGTLFFNNLEVPRMVYAEMRFVFK